MRSGPGNESPKNKASRSTITSKLNKASTTKSKKKFSVICLKTSLSCHLLTHRLGFDAAWDRFVLSTALRRWHIYNVMHAPPPSFY